MVYYSAEKYNLVNFFFLRAKFILYKQQKLLTFILTIFIFFIHSFFFRYTNASEDLMENSSAFFLYLTKTNYQVYMHLV